MAEQPDITIVMAARAGDPVAVDRLVAGYLPLVYTIVGRALEGHADVDDVVQDVMLRVLRNLGDLREPEAFRSWLVAITVRQVRERFRARRGAPETLLHEDVRDPGADFTDLAITRLELSGQRRETAEATRWLDEDNRELLALWWLEASGELTRDEIVEATEVTRQHAAVRIQRMKGQLETARVVVRSLVATPPCPDLQTLTAEWDGRPSPLWRKRIARHTRECRYCSPAWNGLVAAERLLAGMALVPLPAGLVTKGVAVKAGAAFSAKHVAAKVGFSLSRKVLTAALSTTAVAGGAAAVVVTQQPDAPPPVTAAVVAPRATPTSAKPTPSKKPTPTPTTKKPTPKPTTKAPVVITAKASKKKGVGVWEFAAAEPALDDVGAAWYYNWSSTNRSMPGPADVEFVPMIWGQKNVTDATLAEAKKEGDVLLGFNEPDMGGQANMTVEAALDAWPKLEATGQRLGSPAVAFGGDTKGGWLDRFMTGAEQKGYRVDFITLHWYGSDFSSASINQFLGYVDAVHKRYNKPIWVTEYGLMNFSGTPKYPTQAQLVTFINGSTKGMQKRSFVERYAWFGLPAVGDSVDFGLYKDGDSPTEAGKAYKAAG
ncbi:sigma-70 family RNA polymerase sigma factor [Actinoplanes sp. TRM 88003]|uniref:RNA polymerase sigma factor n=1 Tax=Paractinoplanes aksuensis TaxID=2939490 RepID=A0ABT1DTR9_9ACTN|nr:sigma-70 family RNA polymerase sigma factor [Actinoplanes aksuensis]MCO8273101.1 sigma-70 family RNA polymerase sigma factor [Actinoplanes aksuensis]